MSAFAKSKTDNFNERLEKITNSNGCLIFANVETSQIIGYSNINEATKAHKTGSIGKLIAACALLEKGLINTDELINCKGRETINNTRVKCWNPKGHGDLNLEKALAESCNIYFHKALLRIRTNDLISYYRKFQLDKPQIINDYSYINKSNLKTLANLDLLPNDFQEKLTLSPVQMLSLSCTIANKGIFNPLWIKIPARKTNTKSINSKTLTILRNGMSASANYGTSKEFAKTQFRIAAKTGTEKNELNQYQGWCIGFTPHDNPKIAFACFVKNGTGYHDAVPMVIKGLKVCREFNYV